MFVLKFEEPKYFQKKVGEIYIQIFKSRQAYKYQFESKTAGYIPICSEVDGTCTNF